MKYPDFYTEEMRQMEPSDIVDRKVAALLRGMTLEEKLNMVHGVPNPPDRGVVANAAYSCGVARLGVPEMRMYDGPAGTQSLYDTTGLPCHQVLGSSWSRQLAYGYGKVMGLDNAAISGNVQFGAQFDMVRTCHYSRSKDSISEDPYLTSMLAVEETKGIQDQGVICDVKHYATLSQDMSSRYTKDLYIDEQTLHELYLPAFEAAMKEGNAGSAMTCHAMVDGEHTSNNRYLLQEVLRHQWDWKGFVINDWGGNHAFSLPNGLDMETPYGNHNSSRVCRRKLEEGTLSLAEIDTAVSHVLYGMAAAGFLAEVQLDAEGNVLEEPGRTAPIRLPLTYPEKQDQILDFGGKYALELARKGAVLLKNNGVLPLQESDYTDGKSVAMIGLGALHAICGEGGERSFGVLRHMDSPYSCLKQITGEKALVSAAVGVDILGETIPASCFYQDAGCTKSGLVRTYGVTKEDGGYISPYGKVTGSNIFRNDDTGEDKGFLEWNDPTLECHIPGHETGSFAGIASVIDYTVGTIDGKVNRTYKNAEDGRAFVQGEGYTWKGYLKAPEDGEYLLNLNGIGGMCCLKLDFGEGLQDVALLLGREGTQWPWTQIIPTEEGMCVGKSVLQLEAGKIYPLQLTAVAKYKEKDLQLRLSWITPSMRKRNLEDAVQLAAKSDKTVLFLWKLSGNGVDRFDFKGKHGEDLLPVTLPHDQQELLQKVATAVHQNGHQLVCVVNCGTGMVLGDIEKEADAILYMFLPGECGGQATADLLTGRTNPSGRCSGVFPLHNEDTCISDTPEHIAERLIGLGAEPAKVTYSEGIFTSYRWNDYTGVKPLYPFGYGLSYTEFAYSNMHVQPAGDGFDVTVDVTNTGAVVGDEVVQLYLGKAEKVPEGVQMAEKQLCGFERLEGIQPGETRTAFMYVRGRSLCVWNPGLPLIEREDGTRDKWQRLNGVRTIYVAKNAAEMILEEKIEVC